MRKRPADEWQEFRDDDGEPIGLEELKRLDPEHLPEDIRVSVMDNYFPDTTIWREAQLLVCEIQEHLYTKYWEHRFSAQNYLPSRASQCCKSDITRNSKARQTHCYLLALVRISSAYEI